MNSGDSKLKNYNLVLTDILLCLAIIFSVFSQIEPIENITRPIMYVMWILLIIVGCIKKKGKLFIDNFAQVFIISYILFVAFCIITSFIDSEHLKANYIRVLIIPLLVSIIGCMYSDIDKKVINVIGRVYIYCSFLFAVWVQLTYFTSYNLWLNQRLYVFVQKNSAGQIWISAVFVALFLLEYRRKFERVFILLISLYLLVLTGFSQCRTALLGFGVGIIAYAILRAKHKFRLLILLSVVILALLMIPRTRTFIDQALMLNKYAGADMNTFSSGRIDKYFKALNIILESPFIGVGKYYVDNSYILILAESGIFGFAIIEFVWIRKMILCFKYKGDISYKSYLFVISIFYIIESLLEGYPPFGPGVSSFMFWFLSSILIYKSHYYSEESFQIESELADLEELNE